MSGRPRNTIADFWKKVDKSSVNNCWIWTGLKDNDGYGWFRLNGMKRTHRLSVELDGRDPTGMYVLHTCDNPSCVNPEHLYVGTQKENVRDMIIRGRFHSNLPHLNKETI